MPHGDTMPQSMAFEVFTLYSSAFKQFVNGEKSLREADDRRRPQRFILLINASFAVYECVLESLFHPILPIMAACTEHAGLRLPIYLDRKTSPPPAMPSTRRT